MGRPETRRGRSRWASLPPGEHPQGPAQEVLEAAVGVLLQGALDAALGLGPRVAEVDEGGDEVVLRGRPRRLAGRGRLGRRRGPASCP